MGIAPRMGQLEDCRDYCGGQVCKRFQMKTMIIGIKATRSFLIRFSMGKLRGKNLGPSTEAISIRYYFDSTKRMSECSR